MRSCSPVRVAVVAPVSSSEVRWPILAAAVSVAGGSRSRWLLRCSWSAAEFWKVSGQIGQLRMALQREAAVALLVGGGEGGRASGLLEGEKVGNAKEAASEGGGGGGGCSVDVSFSGRPGKRI